MHNAELIDANEFKKHRVTLEVLIGDVDKHLSGGRKKAVKSTRSVDLKEPKTIVGKYVGFNDVCLNRNSDTVLIIINEHFHLKIVSWMINLGKSYPNLIQIYRIGKTFENRPIMLLKVCIYFANMLNRTRDCFISASLKMTHSVKSQETKPLFLFDGGIHAREWVSITTIIYLIDRVRF